MDDQQRMLIEHACARLIVTYCNAYDVRDYDRLIDIFADDGVWRRPGSGDMQGKTAMRAFLDARSEKILLRHCVSNILVDVSGPDSASSESYGIVFRTHGYNGDLPAPLHQPEMVVHYRHRFARRDGRWKVLYHETNWIFKE